jgi:uncharacterized protein (DUF58 family)
MPVMPRRRLYLLEFFRFLWIFKLTPPGRILVIAILLTALGSVTNELPIYQLFSGLLALMAVVEFTGLLFKPRLKITGNIPAQAAAGSDLAFELRVQNVSRWRPAFDVMLGAFSLPSRVRHVDGDVYAACVRPGESVQLPCTLHCERRGIYPLPPIHAVSTFPCNLIRFGGAKTEPGRLVVLPNYEPLDDLVLPVSQRYQPGGVRLTRGIGHSPEFVGNREYVPGEPVRRIDARAWARTGKPVVREFHDEYVSRVAIVLDTCLPSTGRWRQGHEDELEAAISLTAAIVERLNVHEHCIDLFAAGPEMYVFRAASGLQHVDSVLEILAGVEGCRHNPFDDITPLLAEELATISVVVSVFLAWDASRARFIEQVLEAGCVAKSVLVTTAQGDARMPPAGCEFPDDMVIVSPSEITSGGVRQL